MPKGQNPRERSLAKLGQLEAQLKTATTRTKIQKLKTLFRNYTSGTGPMPAENKAVKELRRKIDARQESLLKNSQTLETGRKP